MFAREIIYSYSSLESSTHNPLHRIIIPILSLYLTIKCVCVCSVNNLLKCAYIMSYDV